MAEARILVVGDANSVHLRRWTDEIARRGFEVHVLTRRPGVLESAASQTAIAPGDDAAGWLRALPAVRRQARRIAPDLVHGHYVTSNGFWAAACGIRPLVLTAWGSDLLVTPHESRAKRALTGWVLRRADLLTGDSHDLLAAMRAYRPRARCEEVLGGADVERFCPPEQPRDSAQLHFVSLRAWEPNYNIDVIVEAFAQVQAARPEAALWLLGGGSLEAALRAQVQALGLADRVTLLGRQDDAGMVRAMQRGQVSISVPTSDATSVALLESLACGMAVVASDLPANRQWVDAAGGALVPARDAPALARALLALASDRTRLDAMGRRNREIAVERASRRAQMDRMAALYRELLRGPR